MTVEPFQRACPACGSTITYANRWTLQTAIKNDTRCTPCSWTPERRAKAAQDRAAYNSTNFAGEANPFHGRHHAQSTIEKLRAVDRTYTKTPEFSQRVVDSMVGIDTRVDVMKVWTERYGPEEAQRREQKRRAKISLAMRGEKNPMHGKPAPAKSGIGCKGWYRDWYFRSLHELSFVVCVLEPAGCRWRTAESREFAIGYQTEDGVERTYFPDFVVNDKFIVECKPARLHDTPLVVAKSIAAQAWCTQHDLTYVLLEPPFISEGVLTKLLETGVVKLDAKSQMMRKARCAL